MAQCEKILDDGEHCSNEAVPGTRYCKTHGRIVFRPIRQPADTAPPPRAAEPPATRKKTTRKKTTGKKTARKKAKPDAAAATELVAVPAAARSKPTFADLGFDERGLLVAPQGVVWLEADPDGPPEEPFDRLVRLLSFLSQTVDLPGRVRILRHAAGAGDSLVILTPGEESTALSVVYDAAADAARLVGGRLYVGRDHAFVQYRDDHAPRGYDVPGGAAPPDGEELLLVARWGSRRLRPAEFEEVALADLALRIVPLGGSRGDYTFAIGSADRRIVPPRARVSEVGEVHASDELWALAPPALYPLLARYFRAHHLGYRLARLTGTRGEPVLFEIVPRPGAAVPPFVADYLGRFPRVKLLVSGHRQGSRHVLVEQRRRFPFHLPHLSGAFDADELVLFVDEPYANLRVRPAPTFFEGDRLSEVYAPHTRPPELSPSAGSAAEPELAAPRLPIVLRRDPGPTPPIAALILSARELEWLRQLLYRLPGDAFAAHSLYLGRDRAVLVGGERPIEGIPFGLPLRRHRLSPDQPGEGGLFLPLGSRFVPDLPWTILHEALELRDGVATLLTHDERFDLPVGGFVALSRVVVADPSRRPMELELREAPLPALRWTAPPAPPVDVRRPAPSPKKVAASAPSSAAGQASADDIETYLRREALAFEKAGDHLAAAVCYVQLRDALKSARCYKLASRTEGWS